MTRALLQQAFDFILANPPDTRTTRMNRLQDREDILAAIREYLAQPEQKPVAWLHCIRRDSDVITDAVKHVWGGVATGKEAQYTIPLYLHPKGEE